MKFLAVILSVALIASVSGQDMFRTMMLMRMMGGGGGSGSSSSSRGAGASGGAGNMLSMGRGGFNPAMLAMGGDRMRDMMMCNMYPRSMRSICLMRAFQ